MARPDVEGVGSPADRGQPALFQVMPEQLDVRARRGEDLESDLIR